MKIVVTGGAGFIGSNFILYWLKQHPGDEVINVDALTYAGNKENLRAVADLPNYRLVQADIRDLPAMLQVTTGVDLIVHFAAESHVDRSITAPEIFLQTNVLGTYNLLEAAVRNKVPHFHHVSTDEVFGSLPLGTAEKFTLESKYDPRSPYAASKASSDHLVRAYANTYDLAYTLTNCSNNYGQLQFPEKLMGLAITNILEGKKVPVYGDGLNVRDWLLVTDHVRAIERVITAGKKNTTYLVGGLDKDVSNLEIVKLIANLMGKNADDYIEFVADRAGHDRRYSVDWSVIKQELDWQPEVTIEEGLRQTINWYEANEWWWRPLKERIVKEKLT
jgi:dTDP-glucose 4,6-dehydratase